jgi:hypothetical protein
MTSGQRAFNKTGEGTLPGNKLLDAGQDGRPILSDGPIVRIYKSPSKLSNI